MTSARVVSIALLVVVAGLLSSCETGSKDVTPEYYAVNYSWRQLPDGALLIDGTTDLPDKAEVDAVLSIASPGNLGGVVESAVLIGSAADAGSREVRGGHFTIRLERAVPNTCGPQPPCGPFPGGRYLLLIDARTPDYFVGGGFTGVDDPRFLPTTHGVGGFTGIEIAKVLNLNPIHICIGENGVLGSDACTHTGTG